MKIERILKEQTPNVLTKEDFRKFMEEFWAWTSSRPRTRSAWLSSLEDWTSVEFNRAYQQDHPKNPPMTEGVVKGSREHNPTDDIPEWTVHSEWDGVPDMKPLFKGTRDQCLAFIDENWNKYTKGKGSIGLRYPNLPEFGWSAGRMSSFVLD